jgi:[methyl-Co(III) methanol-specific corrinoid protein]:coenzyme M methyltransferase
MDPYSRLMRVFNHEQPDRTPCMGANSTVTYEQMSAVERHWPDGHEKAEPMAALALAAHTVLGFDAVRVPFCQTMEAEALGCRVKPGKIHGEEGIPGIDQPPPYRLEDSPAMPENFLSLGRIPELLKAVRILGARVKGRVPIVAGIIGPMTIAAAMLDIMVLLKATLKAPEKLLPFMEVAEQAGTTLGRALIEAGADIICCEDMSASPALVAPDTYRDIEVTFQKRQFDALPVPKILHICGNVTPIIDYMAKTGADAISLEPKTDTLTARDRCGPDIILMGGCDTATTLYTETPQRVFDACAAAIDNGIQVLAPGCAVPPATPTANLKAMVAAAKTR